MGIAAVYSFRTLPGGFGRHLEASEEARGRLQALGMRAFTLTPIAGSDVGEIATVINFDDNADWLSSTEKIQSDAGWMEFFVGVANEGVAEQVDASIYTDVDPTFVPDPNRPLGAMQATIWRPNPGRLADLYGHIEQARPHMERLGGTPRILNCMQGRDPMTVGVAVTFEDLAHMGEYQDKLAVDEQWTSFWAGVMSDPTATLVRSGTFRITV